MSEGVTLYTAKTGLPFKVDEEDAFAVSYYRWSIGRKRKNSYPVARIGKGDTYPDSRPIRLHTFLMGPTPKGHHWDHINGDPADNRRSNLRLVLAAENGRNRCVGTNSTTGVVGVIKSCQKKNAKKPYRAILQLGTFATLEEAIAERLRAEKLVWGIERDLKRPKPPW